MKAKRYITALGAFFVLALGIAACGSGVPGNSVADMAGNPISVQAFNHWMFVAAKSQASQNPGQPVIVPNDPPDFKQCVANVKRQIPSLAKTAYKTLQSDCSHLFTSLSGQVMDYLITSYWYQAEAAREHVSISDAQVLKAFTTAKKQQFSTNAQYQAFLTQSGMTQSDIVYRFRVQQVFIKLMAKQNTKVTPAAIQKYYSSHLTQFGTPESRDLRFILTKTAAQAAAAKAALSHGGDWKAVAKKYSIDTQTKKNGGLLSGVVKGQQDQALDAAAFSAPQGVLEGPVKGQFGYYLVEVIKVHASTQQTLAQATPVIRSTLTQQLQSTAQAALLKMVKKHWLSKTTCRGTYAMADCSGYKAPKTSTGTTGTTSTG